MNRNERLLNQGRTQRLGWLSVGLGLTELFAPRTVGRMVGLDGGMMTSALLRAIGIRELVTGVGILTQERPTGFLYARVAGDVMDLALLKAGLFSRRTDPWKLSLAIATVAGVALIDLKEARRLGREGKRSTRAGTKLDRGGLRIHETITINRKVEDVYRFFRDFENLPLFMSHLESVEVLNDRRSRWRAKAPVGQAVEWEAEIVEDRTNRLIAWQSLAGAHVDNRGAVTFIPAPGNRGAEIHVELEFLPPGGKLGFGVAKLFREAPDQQIRADLRHLKQVMETGEVLHSDSSIHRFKHPARPSGEKRLPGEEAITEERDRFEVREITIGGAR